MWPMFLMWFNISVRLKIFSINSNLLTRKLKVNLHHAVPAATYHKPKSFLA